MLAKVDRQVMNAAIERLPVEFKEALLLREFEDLSYKEIAMIADVPEGTVMSRLARARALLTKTCKRRCTRGCPNELRRVSGVVARISRRRT
jgi:RNA polymerase sigma factor (sigma-70 family)